MLFFKLLAIGLLTCVILIALYMISDTISSRQAYREDAVKSIASSYATTQTVVGPLLVRPYTQTLEDVETDGKGVKKLTSRKVENSIVVFPHELTIQGVMTPSERHHGLYRVPVYEFVGHLAGAMDVNDPELEGKVVWGSPYFALAVSDVRGIVGSPKMLVNGVEAQIYQGGTVVRNWQPNLRVPLRVSAENIHGRLSFALDITLAGTERLDFAPVGDSNHIELSSTWPSPLFGGRFLPRTREVGSQGFKAEWDVSSLATGTQQQMMSATPDGVDLLNVSLITPIDPYKLSDRAVKYGILFVLLTFGGFFIFEIMERLPIHPVQYLLVGFGLAIFFLLLISFSEHMVFPAAYLISSAACIGLLTFYLSFVLRSKMRGFGFGALLTTLYAAIYGLLISEDNALLLGALLLFAVLAGVMYVTRRVDWYAGSAALMAAKAPGHTVPPPPPLQEAG